MEYSYCPNCGKMTGQKRALGWGTFFGGVFTAGVSILAIPFYPKRCIVCGRESSGKESKPQYSSPYEPQEAELPSKSMPQERDVKKCPVCAEVIKIEAIKCRFCGEKFDPSDVAQQVAELRNKYSFENRVLCSDGNCNGLVGPDGRCKVCGQPYEPKKNRNAKNRSSKRKTNKIKAAILLIVAFFFFVYMIYAGGTIGSFLSLIIGLVCGLVGILYLLRGNRGT